ncbi:MAG: hypothetical protein M1582_01350 [Actinobacteria bacterium]|nr:hypothetical protein [Actinomycetota bacterium]
MNNIHSQASISRRTYGLPPSTEMEHSPETRVNILSFAARVAGNCPTVLRDLALLYPKPEMDSSPIPGPVAAPFAVVEHNSDSSERCYRLYEDGREVSVVASSENAVAQLEMLVNAAAVASFAGYLLIHAGMVATPSGGVMIPAASGAGKSTLVAALSLSGFDYLSDEVAVLEPESLAALPFPKAICLKDGGLKKLAASFDAPAPLVHAVRAGGEALHYVAVPNHPAPERRTRVRYIVLPFRQTGSRATLTPFSRAVTLAELARNSLNLPRHGASGVEVLAQLVEQAECFTLTYEDLRDAVGVISELVGLAPKRGTAGRA